MKEYTCSQERFPKDTEKHTMEIVRAVFEFDGDSMESFYGCKEWTHGFIWNCYAIIWGIKQFDALFPDLIKPCKE